MTGSNAPSSLDGGPSYWMRDDVGASERWTEVLTSDVVQDVAKIARTLAGRELSTLTNADLPSSGPLFDAAKRWRRELERGRGFVLLRGLSVGDEPAEELALTFAVMGLHLGSPVSQNLRGELMTHVRDTGADPNLPSTRLYTTRAEQDFHTDGADIIGLLCRRTSRTGGASRIVSSGSIIAEIQRARPDLYAQLFEEFPWRYQEEGMPPFVLSRPICSAPTMGARGARLNTFFIPWYIRRSQDLEEAPKLTPLQHEAIEMIERLANDPRFYIDMTFEPGDVQWLKNAAILHKRTAYEDFDEPDKKRHLLRLWLSAPDFEDGDAQLRAGVTQEITR